MTYSVAIIGLGKIGWLFDKNLPVDAYAMSHVRAFTQHQEFTLVAVSDPSLPLRDEFFRAYQIPTFASVNELLTHVKADIVVVATPTSTHAEIINQILTHSHPRAILCEKPLSYDSNTARLIVQACANKQVALYVNYIRRADPGVREIKQRINSGQLLLPFKSIVWYSKGLLHNGSHFADLLTYWFGPVQSVSLIHPGRLLADNLADNDAEPDFQMTFEHGSALFCAAQEENYSHYTVEIVATNGRLRYEQRGEISWQAAAAHQTLPDYRQLQPQAEIIPNDMNRYQYWVTEQLSQALSNAPNSLCNGTDAAKTTELLETLVKECRNRKAQHG
jgi:predicted dehydrogenase